MQLMVKPALFYYDTLCSVRYIGPCLLRENACVCDGQRTQSGIALPSLSTTKHNISEQIFHP